MGAASGAIAVGNNVGVRPADTRLHRWGAHRR